MKRPVLAKDAKERPRLSLGYRKQTYRSQVKLLLAQSDLNLCPETKMEGGTTQAEVNENKASQMIQ